MRPPRGRPKPTWLKVRLPGGEGFRSVRAGISGRGLATVCDEARCPNRGECFARGTATIMVLGRTCTRGCGFCSVASVPRGEPPDLAEPSRVAAAVAELGLSYIVLTMVSRDDLPDGGASHVAACVAAIHEECSSMGVEILGSDFGGDRGPLARVASSGAQVLAHNLEVVRRLTPRVRHPRSNYDRSLLVLRTLRELAPTTTPTKSSLLLGLGESHDEVLRALDDLLGCCVSLLTIGQYLQPGRGQLPVVEYLHPDRFARYEEIGTQMGFTSVVAGPLVRSSYRAEHQYLVAVSRGVSRGDKA